MPDAQLTNGLAKLCQAFDIDMGHYGIDMWDGEDLHLEKGPVVIHPA